MNANELRLSDKTIGEIRKEVSQLQLTLEERSSLCGEIFFMLRNEQETLKVMMDANAGNEVNAITDHIHRLKAALEVLG